ncbi:hypothetical protein [Entomobacter blattae]|uniref:DUF2628 domain-containing protein n=1 Tax=Entomobacter blattae TaxID=2762277 RepID=A0A7H1NUM8_9PROT|nr:hypothetical protein [Entomobacter blattae]QNT79488.1 hypothetical protein JGUZn3_22870 [Entomobacter blattae]
MKIFQVYLPYRPSLDNPPILDEEHPPIVVKEGFSWLVLFFGWLGLIVKKSYIAGTLVAAATLLIHTFIQHFGATYEWLGALAFHFTLATFTPEILKWELRLKSYRPESLILGRKKQEALLRFLDHRTYLQQTSPSASDGFSS